jgi:NitT/TauT family transport system substrate-binding protein
LLALGARELFSSADIPGRIVDVLAVRRSALVAHGDHVAMLVAAHFRALADWRREPARMAPLMAPRMGLAPEAVPAAFTGLELPDLAHNREWLGGGGRLLATAREVAAVMRRTGLLPERPAEAGKALPGVDGRFLPAQE